MDFIQKLKENLDKVPTSSAKILQKKDAFLNLLEKETIDLKALRKLSFQGIPDEYPSLRSIVWKLLIGYLPTKKKYWVENYQEYDSNYQTYVKDFIQIKKSEKDHPLSKKQNSSWQNYFKDMDLFEEVQKDTQRTRSELHTFVAQVQDPPPIVNVFRKEKKPIAHYEIMTRILFIYAKLNQGIKYIQGMNEILAPLYYVFLQDKQLYQKYSYEQESFFCFTIIMSDIKDNFLKSLDASSSGIKAKVKRFENLLEQYDQELHAHLQKQGVDPHFYSLRWIMLMLTQEFKLNDVLRLWDSLLSQENMQLFELDPNFFFIFAQQRQFSLDKIFQNMNFLKSWKLFSKQMKMIFFNIQALPKNYILNLQIIDIFIFLILIKIVFLQILIPFNYYNLKFTK